MTCSPSSRIAYSVIIPAFGRPQFLADAIASVLAQGVGELEIIVVDDASPEPICVQFDERVRVVRLERNRGPAGARNEGVRNSTGSAVAFLDDDDRWLPGRLDGVAEVLARHSVCVCWQAESGRRFDGHVHDSILDDTTPSLGATVLRRDVWVDMDESLRSCEDLDWWLRISTTCTVGTVARQGLDVRRHDGDRAGYGLTQRIQDSRLIMSRHREYFSTHRNARSQRWKSIGLSHLALHQGFRALGAFGRSFLARPSLKGVAHLGRAVAIGASRRKPFVTKPRMTRQSGV
jgi:glycosyltransferase involved in cell wall biosynthesis